MGASHFDRKKKGSFCGKWRVAWFCASGACGWWMGAPVPQGMQAGGVPGKQWVAIGVPLHTSLAVAGCCPSFALLLSGARHIVRTDFIYWFTQTLLRNPVVRGIADSGLGVGMEAVYFFSYRPRKHVLKVSKVTVLRARSSSKLCLGVPGCPRLSYTWFCLVLQKDFPCINNFGCDLGFF